MPFFDFGPNYPRLGAVQALLWTLSEVNLRIRHAPYLTLMLVDDLERWVNQGFSFLIRLVEAYETLGEEFPEMEPGGNVYPRMR